MITDSCGTTSARWRGPRPWRSRNCAESTASATFTRWSPRSCAVRENRGLRTSCRRLPNGRHDRGTENPRHGNHRGGGTRPSGPLLGAIGWADQMVRRRGRFRPQCGHPDRLADRRPEVERPCGRGHHRLARAEAEWEETRLKARAVLDALVRGSRGICDLACGWPRLDPPDRCPAGLLWAAPNRTCRCGRVRRCGLPGPVACRLRRVPQVTVLHVDHGLREESAGPAIRGIHCRFSRVSVRGPRCGRLEARAKPGLGLRRPGERYAGRQGAREGDVR